MVAILGLETRDCLKNGDFAGARAGVVAGQYGGNGNAATRGGRGVCKGFLRGQGAAAGAAPAAAPPAAGAAPVLVEPAVTVGFGVALVMYSR